MGSNKELLDSPLEQFPGEITEFAHWKKLLNSVISHSQKIWRNKQGINASQEYPHWRHCFYIRNNFGQRSVTSYLLPQMYLFHWDKAIYKWHKSKKVERTGQLLYEFCYNCCSSKYLDFSVIIYFVLFCFPAVQKAENILTPELQWNLNYDNL